MQIGDRVMAEVDGQKVELVVVGIGDKTGKLYLAYPNSTRIVVRDPGDVEPVTSELREPLVQGDELDDVAGSDDLRLDDAEV